MTCRRCLIRSLSPAPVTVIQESDPPAPPCAECGDVPRIPADEAVPAEGFRWFFAWHPETEFTVIRSKGAQGLGEWLRRDWRDFPARPEIVDCTEGVGAAVGSGCLKERVIRVLTMRLAERPPTSPAMFHGWLRLDGCVRCVIVGALIERFPGTTGTPRDYGLHDAAYSLVVRADPAVPACPDCERRFKAVSPRPDTAATRWYLAWHPKATFLEVRGLPEAAAEEWRHRASTAELKPEVLDITPALWPVAAAHAPDRRPVVLKQGIRLATEYIRELIW